MGCGTATPANAIAAASLLQPFSDSFRGAIWFKTLDGPVLAATALEILVGFTHKEKERHQAEDSQNYQLRKNVHFEVHSASESFTQARFLRAQWSQ
jgi:hypothetical protein